MADAIPIRYPSDTYHVPITYPESEWQSFQPPSPLAPGRSAEQASCLSLTAQLASEIFKSLKKSSLGVYSSHLEPSQAISGLQLPLSILKALKAQVPASQEYDKIEDKPMIRS